MPNEVSLGGGVFVRFDKDDTLTLVKRHGPQTMTLTFDQVWGLAHAAYELHKERQVQE